MADARSPWPPLPIASWADTCATLHMWTQIIGKVRLALAPMMNHWWQVPLYVTARGLTTSPMPYDDEAVQISFDFIDHFLAIEATGGGRRTIRLAPQSVAAFYRQVMTALDDLGMPVHIWPVPVEIPDPIPFERDDQHASYDAAAVDRWWRAVSSADRVFTEFRARFLGKSSPVHLFWGSFDLAVTRFNGKPTDAKRDADAMTREAYSHEVISAGFWPGRPGVVDAAFYAYAVPEPDGFRTATIGPRAAAYSAELGEFLLPYEEVRSSRSPRESLLEFLQTTYDAAATLARWDEALQRGRESTASSRSGGKP